VICHGFFTWLENGRNTLDIPLLPRQETKVMRVYDNQTEIGWQHFVRVRMVIEWGNLINDHLSTQRRYTFSAEYWGSKNIVNKLEIHIRIMGTKKQGSAWRYTRNDKDNPTPTNDR
jgi:hypothetical protein